MATPGTKGFKVSTAREWSRPRGARRMVFRIVLVVGTLGLFVFTVQAAGGTMSDWPGDLLGVCILLAIPALVALLHLLSPPDVCIYCDSQTKVREVNRVVLAQEQGFGTERVYIRQGSTQWNSNANVESNYTRSYPTLQQLCQVTNQCGVCGNTTTFQQRVTRRIG